LFMYSKILSIVSHFATVVVIGSLLFVSILMVCFLQMWFPFVLCSLTRSNNFKWTWYGLRYGNFFMQYSSSMNLKVCDVVNQK
jgi:hypothetical protein